MYFLRLHIFDGIGCWIQGFVLARQTFYHSSHGFILPGDILIEDVSA
jgi:hypothetical protein